MPSGRSVGEALTLCYKCQLESWVDKEIFLHDFQGMAAACRILIGRTWMLPAVADFKTLRWEKADSTRRSRIGMSGVKVGEAVGLTLKRKC
jgi:hypothetical protein